MVSLVRRVSADDVRVDMVDGAMLPPLILAVMLLLLLLLMLLWDTADGIDAIDGIFSSNYVEIMPRSMAKAHECLHQLYER